MKTINIIPGSLRNALSYDKEEKAFYGSEKNIAFDTSYEVFNVDTEKSEVFNFTHSTGPEFDPNTQWVYESENGLKMIICNDANITNQRAKMYLKAKTRN